MSWLAKKKLRVAILGCGPAGLFAAHAATELDAEVSIFSKARPSHLFGAQALESHIPGIVERGESFPIFFELTGSLENYVSKIFGPNIPDPGKIRRSDIEGTRFFWDIRKAYSVAWDLYGDTVRNLVLDAESMLTLIPSYDLIVSTIPAPQLCTMPKVHAFDFSPIWAIGDAPERGVEAPIYNIPDNTVWYDGTEYTGWHRAASIQGYKTMEWPEDHKPPLPEVAEVRKPTVTTCDCWLAPRKRGAKVVRFGRYGEWAWSGKAHQSYWGTIDAMKGL